jgi:PAS domain S-box-containing protein
MDLNNKLAHYSREARLLEAAYASLQEQFYALKEKLESSRQTLEQMVTYISDGLMFITVEGKITLVNPAAAELIGHTCDRMVHGEYWDHFPDHFFGFSMREALKKSSFHQRIFLTLNDEKEIEVSTSSIPQKGVVLLLCDRTEQQRLEKGLNQTERLKELGEMAAALAHEIRNPLGGIEGFAQLLKRDLETPTQQRMIQAILEGTRTLKHLVAEVLDYARPMRLHFASVDLVDLIQKTLILASASANMPTCSFKCAHAAYPLVIDQEQIKLVLLNLLRNAHEAKATVVEIDLTEQGALIVSDNGAGMSQKELKKIFTPFFTTKARGTGLGLAHALAVIKAHDGTLEVASEEGKGTQFTLKLTL